MTDLKTKYRPTSFKKMFGNEETIESLQAAINKNELPHSILLTGPRGCGKTTLGRIVANEIGCDPMDYQEIDSGAFRGIATVNDLRETIPYGPKKGECRVILIDEVHMLGQGGDSEKNIPQNALLKLLEEPPKYLYYILATTNPERLIGTIRSRCTNYSVAPLSSDDAALFLKKITKKEKISLPSSVLSTIADVAHFHPRDMLSYLSKIMYLDSPAKMKRLLKTINLEESAEVIDLCRLMMDGKGSQHKRWESAAEILKKIKGIEPEKMRRAILGYASSTLLNGNGKASYILGWFLDKPTYDCGFPLIVQNVFNVIHEIEPPC